MAEEEKSISDWIKWAVGILMLALAAFGIANWFRANDEEKKRIAAQNEIAVMSTVVAERDGLWSRLSVQKDNIIDDLRSRNSQLADMISSREASILSLSETIANFRPVRIIVRPGNVTQVPDPTDPNRTRVSFNESVDPVRIEGFTLTNPPEAEVDVSFVRPLRLRTTITQEPNGQWRTYVEGDWPNVEIEQMETIVNPRPNRVRAWPENVILGGNLSLSVAPSVDSVSGEIHAMYDFDSFAIGPSIGINYLNNQSRMMVGLEVDFHPWRQP